MNVDFEAIQRVRDGLAMMEYGLTTNDEHRVWFALRNLEEDALIARNSLPPMQQATANPDVIIT